MTTLKSKLPVLVGTWLQIGHPIVAEIAAYKDFDWICVDLEHSPTTIETMTQMFRAISTANPKIMLTVRVRDHSPKTMSRCLDAGAECLIIPQVETYDQALKIVEAAYYPPMGKRGLGYARSNQYGSKPMANKCKIIVQIEHYKTIGSELVKMVKHPLIDGAFIGPLDLEGSLPKSKSTGQQMMVLLEQFREIVSAKKDKYMGIHIVVPSPQEVGRAIRAGFNFIAMGVDTSLLSKSMDDLFIGKE